MKKILLLAALFASFVSNAQNIESKIPSSAEAVVSVNGDRLTELISIKEFDNYNFAKELFKNLSRNIENTATLSSIKDFGFDINSKAFYFYTKTDSISYHNFLIKLSDKTKYENLLSERDKEKIVTLGNLNMMEDYGAVTIWNDHLLLFCKYENSYNYFSENEERFRLEYEDESFYSVKEKISAAWAKTNSLNLFNNNAAVSILTNKDYLASKDKKAGASLWVKNYGQLLGSALNNVYALRNIPSISALQSSSSLYGFKSIVANLYFDDNATRMTTEMEVSSEWEKIFKKFYNSKMDPNFFNYFNQNEALAYMSVSMDMQALFEEYPALMASMYGGILPDYKEEMELGTDLFSLLLDEEAIGELMTGDILITLNDISEKEVTYTTYEYDEDYKKSTTTLTKKEVLPDFTIMVGSKKGKLLNKAAGLAIKYQLFENRAGYYRVNAPKNEIPIDLFAVVKNDILFFTTSEENILDIINDRFVNNLGKHKKLIKNNSSIFYVNGKLMMDKLPLLKLSGKEKTFIDYAKDNFIDAHINSSKMKGNKILSEMRINTSDSQENSLKAFLNFIELIAN